MITKLVGVATLFAAGSILVAGTPTLGARSLDNQISASSPDDRRCGGGGGGRRCGGGHYCAFPVPACATRTCGYAKK